MSEPIQVDTSIPGKKIYAQIAKVMSDLEAIGKNQRNDQQKFNFRGIDAVYNELHEHMAKHGVFTTSRVLSFDRVDKVSRNGGAMIHMLAKIEYTFHADDGSTVTTEVFGESADSGDKSATKCLAIAHKYAMLQIFMIPTEDTKGDEKDPDHYSPEFEPVVLPKGNAHAQANQGATRPQNGWASSPQQGGNAGPRNPAPVQAFPEDDIPDPAPQRVWTSPRQSAVLPAGATAQRSVPQNRVGQGPPRVQAMGRPVPRVPSPVAPNQGRAEPVTQPSGVDGPGRRAFAERREAARAALNEIESKQAEQAAFEDQPSFDEFNNEPGSEG